MNQAYPPTPFPPIHRQTVSGGRSVWFWAVGLGILMALLTIRVIGDFSHPLSDGNDTDQFEYVGYFFYKNLSLWPFPHLNLINTQTFYPYGTNQVFLDWGFERDYWYSFCYRLFNGPGPYLQYYYVYSLVVASVGTFVLLQSRFGINRSLILGLVVSVFNFYALFKFPVHMNICVAHWTTLCIVATYRLLYDVVMLTPHPNPSPVGRDPKVIVLSPSLRGRGWGGVLHFRSIPIVTDKPISLSFILFWMWLHVQVLSQELAYVAGFALSFTTLTVPVLALVLYRQFPVFKQWLPSISDHIQEQFTQQRNGILLMLMLLAISLYLYLPLTLQIALTAWSFDFSVVPELPAWNHPMRLFIPYLPGLHTFDFDYRPFLHDTFESFGQGSPGLYLVVLAGIGWWQNRRRVAIWLPVVLLLGLCLLYHPVLFPTLKIFPWFSFNRHGGRASLVYPVLLGLLALFVRWPRQLPGKIIGVLLLGLMITEWYTGYTNRLTGQVNTASDSVLAYCAVVRKQPGVAVLDFPFCTIGGDGVGMQEGLCPYYKQQNAVFTFRRFYDKSGVGQYFGRLHPDQIQPFLRDGWPRLLAPSYVFSKADWQFLDAFLQNNNFAGINLYPNLLTPEQVTQFYRHYGTPIAETAFPAAGKVVFIPLPGLAGR